MTDTTGPAEVEAAATVVPAAPVEARPVPSARRSTAAILAVLSLVSYLAIIASGWSIFNISGLENAFACGAIVTSAFALLFGIVAAFVARSRWRWLALGTTLASPLAGLGTFYVFAMTEAAAIGMWWWWILVAITAALYLTVAVVDVTIVVRAVRERGAAAA